MSQFIHLHTHSNYSFCRGAATIRELCTAAKNAGMTHLALTDRNGIYGLGWFLDTAREYGLVPLIGVHLVHKDSECVLLAKNIAGYRFLCKAVTCVHNNKDLSLFDILSDHDADTFILSKDRLRKQRLWAWRPF